MPEFENSEKINKPRLKIAQLSGGLPMVTVLVPCRNEKRFIGACLNSIINNDYPEKLLEIIVLDGESDDGSKEVIEDFSRRFSRFRVFENKERITPAALNLGISNARGEVIIWMSSHNRYNSDYISLSVKSLLDSGADNVGGIMITLPRENTLLGRCIAACLSHPFGVGNSSFRVHPDKPVWVDTVFGGCYRREVFKRIGMFNEDLVRGQDMEFNLRLKKAGGRILLDPAIVCTYYARSDMKSFLKHNWANGVWAILPFLYSKVVPVSLRHLIPLAFASGLIGLTVLSVIWPVFMWLFWGIVGFYLVLNLAAAFHVSLKKGDLRYLLVMPVVFASLHICYGLGSCWGVIKGIARFLKGPLQTTKKIGQVC